MRAIEISGTNRSQAITLPVNPLSFEISQIGRASCRERVSERV